MVTPEVANRRGFLSLLRAAARGAVVVGVDPI